MFAQGDDLVVGKKIHNQSKNNSSMIVMGTSLAVLDQHDTCLVVMVARSALIEATED